MHRDASSAHFLVVRDPAEAVPELDGAIVAIGNFDGVHRGHRSVLARARDIAGEEGRSCVAFTFEPHPRTFFAPAAPVFRLTPEHAKLVLFEQLGLDGAVVLTFDAGIAGMEAEDFVRVYLRERVAAAHVCVGYDFHFGKARRGTPDFLAAMGERLGFGVTIMQPYQEGGEPVSSSAVRAALADGDIVLANRLLGYEWFVEGEVLHGDKRGRELGYPTANLRLAPETELRHGIYAVRVEVDGAEHDGVASFGRRPTFDNGAPLLEAHLFDFAGDLYGRTIRVVLVEFIRPEARFDSADDLIRQMAWDSDAARAMLSKQEGA